jgi:hypothetical protein
MLHNRLLVHPSSIIETSAGRKRAGSYGKKIEEPKESDGCIIAVMLALKNILSITRRSRIR